MGHEPDEEQECPGGGENGGEDEKQRKGSFRETVQDFLLFFRCQLVHFYLPRLRHTTSARAGSQIARYMHQTRDRQAGGTGQIGKCRPSLKRYALSQPDCS